MAVAPREITLPGAFSSVYSAAKTMCPAEPAVIAMPMADASKRGELTGTCGCERDILDFPSPRI
jgi:hypothetical protein